MQLAQQLKDKAASVACEAALRIAIRASNCFDFASPAPFIEQWIKQNTANGEDVVPSVSGVCSKNESI